MSKQQAPLQTLTYKASGAVAAYRGIDFSGAQATIQGQKVMGISQRPADDGKYSDAVVSGTAVVETGGNFVAGDSLIMDAFVTSSAANGATVLQGSDLPEYVFADALDMSTAVGQFVEVLLRR